MADGGAHYSTASGADATLIRAAIAGLLLTAGLSRGWRSSSPLRSRLPHGYTVLRQSYEAAGLICHQRPERSFHLAGIQPQSAPDVSGSMPQAQQAGEACLAGLQEPGERLPDPQRSLSPLRRFQRR